MITLKQISDIIMSQLTSTGRLAPKSISTKDNLYIDIGLDSLDIMEIVIATENKYNIQINDSKLSNIVYVEDILSLFNAA